VFRRTWISSFANQKNVHSPVARFQQKDNYKHTLWKGAREGIASIDDGGWSQSQRE
jgi:hypothetical protein